MRFSRALLLGLTVSLPAPVVPALAAPQDAPATSQSQEAVDRERGTFARFLDSHPEIADDVASDPRFLKDDTYLREHPELQAFFEAHPLVKADPRAFLSSRRRVVFPEPSVIDKITPVLVFLCVFLGVLWALRSLLENRRWSKAAAVQSEIHAKLLERFASSQEMLAYMQTEAGRRFLESGTLAVDTLPARTPPVLARILASVQVGLVLVVVGIGFLWLWGSEPGGEKALLVLGTLVTALGLGFLLSAAASWGMSRRLGLLPGEGKIQA
jgi:hypothetical protein